MINKEKEAMDFAMQVFDQLPKADREQLELNMTAVLIVFWSALWGTFGTEYARGFIESQLEGMNGDSQKFVKKTH